MERYPTDIDEYFLLLLNSFKRVPTLLATSADNKYAIGVHIENTPITQHAEWIKATGKYYSVLN